MVTPEDLPYIISDVLKHETIAQHVKVINYTLNLSQGLKPVAIIAIEVNGKHTKERLPATDNTTHS